MIIDIVLGKATGRGGLEEVLSVVSNELNRQNYRVRIFQMNKPDHLEWLDTLQEIYYYDQFSDESISASEDDYTLYRYGLGYRDLLDKLGYPDVVFATHVPLMSLVCRLALSHLGDKRPPILSWLHGPPSALGGGQALKYSDAHLAISHAIAQEIQDALEYQQPIYYVGNPIKPVTYDIVKKPDDGMKILYIGRLYNHEKRLDILLESLQSIKGNWSLDIYGDGEDREKLELMAQTLRISNRICWKGWIDDPWFHVEEASLLVLTSDYEGFGMVLVEALARGIPVLSTDTEGPSEIIKQGGNGWLIPKGDVQTCSTFIQNLVSELLPIPSSEACVQSIEDYKLDRVINRLKTGVSYAQSYYESEYSLFSNLTKITPIMKLKYYVQYLSENSEISKYSQFTKFISTVSVNPEELIDFIISVSSNPSSEFLTQLGVIFWSDEQLDYCIPFFKKALEINPHNDDALYNLGCILLMAGEREKGLFYLKMISQKTDEVLELLRNG